LDLINLGLNISWTLNSNYETEITYNINDTEWVEIIVDQGNSTIIDTNPNDTIEVRARFKDGSRYSASYATATIEIWEMTDIALYGLTERSGSQNEEPFLGNTVYSLVEVWESLQREKLKTFTIENTVEANHVIAWHPNGYLYRLILKGTEYDSPSYKFERVNISTLEVVDIPITTSTPEFDINCPATAMVYHPNENAFFVCSSCGFYKLATNGSTATLELINVNSPNSLVYDGGLITAELYGSNIDFWTVNITGIYESPSLFAITTTDDPDYVLTGIISLAIHNGTLYAISSGNAADNSYTGLLFITISDDVIRTASVIARLTAPFKRLASVIVDQVPVLVVQQVSNGFSGLHHLSEGGVVGDLIVDTRACCNLEEFHSMSFNPRDRHIYHSCMRLIDYAFNTQDPDVNSVLVFEKLNLDTLEVSNISVSGSNYVRGIESDTQSFIDDGGEDMYDDGNVLSTNLVDNGFIEYTHTIQSSVGDTHGEDFVQTADGTVADGTDYFGNGSSYFTNMYTGLFVMVATNINITEFVVSGELGADGDGIVSSDVIALNGGHTGYFKKVYDSGDPSVNHLIIIPSKNGVVQSISENTDDDFHLLSNLSGVNRIYYLLFATKDNENNVNDEVTSEQAATIGNLFLSAIGSQNINQILSNLNDNYLDVTDNITDLFAFTDANDGNQHQITEMLGYRPGLNEPHCMTYAGNDKFFIASEEGLFSITSDGHISLINSEFRWGECRGLAFVEGRLYASYSFGTFLVEINPITGEQILQVNEKGSTIVFNGGEGNTTSIRALASDGIGLYVLGVNNEHTEFAVGLIVNLVPDENNEIFATYLVEFKTIGGLTIERFGRTAPIGNVFIEYTETSTSLHLNDTTQVNADELEVQWHEDDNANQSFEDWNPIAVEEVLVVEDYTLVIINKTASSFKARMRFINPLSKWSYFSWN